MALAGMSVSDDGRYVAYGRSEAGSDWKTWRIRAINGPRVRIEQNTRLAVQRIHGVHDVLILQSVVA
ncbi:MAG: hypothetical protein AAF432_09430 [Planctomycetota bacterium]